MKSLRKPFSFGWLIRSTSLIIVLMSSGLASAQWQTVWELGAPGRGWPQDQGGVLFVAEANTNPPPGDPMSPAVDREADDDYYVAGTYPDPIGTVPDELVSERAFAGTDNDLRMHFNLGTDLDPADKFRFSFEPWNLDDPAEARYGIEIYANDNLVMPEMIVTRDDLQTVFTTPEFTAAEAGLFSGPGGDNVIWAKGISYSAEGGGAWMGIDYHHLEMNPIPEPGSLGMMLSGLIWAIPFICYERNNGRKRR